MADSVLQRPMFSAPQQTGGIAPTVGIATARSPSQTANELRNMFAPAVPVAGPPQGAVRMVEPVQSFQGGGLAQKIGAAALDVATLPYQLGAGFFGAKPTSLTPFYDEYVRRAAGQTGEAPPSPVQMGGAALGDVLSSPVPVIQRLGNILDPNEISAPSTYTPRFDVLRRGEAERVERSMPTNPPEPPRPPGRVYELPEATEVSSGPVVNPALADRPAAPTPPPERQKGALELTLEGIKAERAKSAEEKKQNALLALMQAGFAMAAGRSPSALSNIAAGGQAGIAAFAGMEKDRRAEDAALRREETALVLERERMRAQEERAPEQIRTYAALGGWDPTKGREGFDEAVRRGIEITKSLEKEPDTMRLIKALGGGDIVRGFEVYKGDESLQAARATVGNMMAPEESRRNAQTYLDARIQQSLQSLQGGQGGRTPPPGSTVIPWNQLPR